MEQEQRLDTAELREIFEELSDRERAAVGVFIDVLLERRRKQSLPEAQQA